MKVEGVILYQISTDRYYKVGDKLEFGKEYNYQGERVCNGAKLNKRRTYDDGYSFVDSRKIFANKKLVLDMSKQLEEYDFIYKELEKRNYIQYEVSNYSLKGYESRHNLVYWNAKEYYGFGLGASGYVNLKRYINTKNLTKYLNKDYNRQYEEINIDDDSAMV
jgi:hypothetical protein